MLIPGTPALEPSRLPVCSGGKERDAFPTGGNREMHRKEDADLTLTAPSSVSIPVPRQDPVPSQVDADFQVEGGGDSGMVLPECFLVSFEG